MAKSQKPTASNAQSKIASVSTAIAGGITNRIRNNEIIVGINGIAQAGTPNVLLPANRRWHAILLTCLAVNYTGGNALATKRVTGAGNNDLTINLTVGNGTVLGVPNAATVVVGGTGYVTGDIITPVDATGTGAQFTVTANAGAVTALVYVANSATSSPINPAQLMSACKLVVNNSPVRDIPVDSLLRLLWVRGIATPLGSLLLQMTESDRKFLGIEDSNSWDLTGGGTLQILIQLNNYLLPAVTGNVEWDSLGNSVVSGGASMALPPNPIWYKETVLNLNVGENDFNQSNLTLNPNRKIQRLYFLGATPGNITRLEIYQDNSKRAEFLVPDLITKYTSYGFDFGRPNWLNQNSPTSLKLQGAYNPPSYFDAALITDYDGRLAEALQFNGTLSLRIFSAVQQSCRVTMELAPGTYSGT